MNFKKAYIKEVHEVKQKTTDWGTFVIVEMTTIIEGVIEKGVHAFSNMEAWEDIKERGYFFEE